MTLIHDARTHKHKILNLYTLNYPYHFSSYHVFYLKAIENEVKQREEKVCDAVAVKKLRMEKYNMMVQYKRQGSSVRPQHGAWIQLKNGTCRA